MPAVARLSARPAAASPAPFQVFDLRARPVPPSRALVALILDEGDLQEDLGAGRVRRGLSAGKLVELAAQGRLDVPAARAADLAVVWDEVEGEVVHVLDDAPLRARIAAQPAWWDLWEAEEPAPARARHAWGAAR